MYGAAQVDFFITAVDFGPEPEPEKVLPCPACHPPCTQSHAQHAGTSARPRTAARGYGFELGCGRRLRNLASSIFSEVALSNNVTDCALNEKRHKVPSGRTIQARSGQASGPGPGPGAGATSKY